MQIYVPDTNFFLQCKPADQLDWSMITTDAEVALLVVREVRKELDRHKGGGNHRRAKRARAASSLMRRFISENVREIEIRNSGPRVVLRLAPRPADGTYPKGYPVETPDERIVAEAYVAQADVGQLVFLSHDTVPLEDARAIGLSIGLIPDSWLLEPEAGEIEKELSEVKRRMKALEGRAPKIVIGLGEDEHGRVVVPVMFFPPVSQAFIDCAMRAVRDKFAPGPYVIGTMPTGHDYRQLFEKVGEQAWARYVNEHNAWLPEVEETLQDGPRYFSQDPRGMALRLTVANDGNAGADNLIIRIRTKGDVHLLNPDSLDKEKDPEAFFPRPPSRPGEKARTHEMLGVAGIGSRAEIRRILLGTPRKARSRHEINWEYEHTHHSYWAKGECVDFRHGMDAKEVVLWLERVVSDDQPAEGALEVLISAGNIAETKRQIYPVRVEPKIEDTEQLLRDLLKRELGVDV